MCARVSDLCFLVVSVRRKGGGEKLEAFVSDCSWVGNYARVSKFLV